MNERCLLCHSKELKVVKERALDGPEHHQDPAPQGISIAQCELCGLLNYLPRPTREELRDYHGENYFVCPREAEQTSYANYVAPDHRDSKRLWGRHAMGWFFQHDQQRRKPEKTILDVGCATGFMLEGALELRWS